MSKKEQQANAAQEAQAAPRQPLAEPEGGWPSDEFTGQAGSFVRDPYTGQRSRLAEPTAARPGALA